MCATRPLKPPQSPELLFAASLSSFCFQGKSGKRHVGGKHVTAVSVTTAAREKKIKLAEHVTLEINFERVSVVSGKGGTKRERPCMACEAQFWLTDTFYTIFACLKSLHQQLIVYIWRALQPWAYFQPVIYCSALGTLVTLCKSSTVFPFSCFKDGEEPVVEEGWGLWWCSLGQTGGGDREEHN